MRENRDGYGSASGEDEVDQRPRDEQYVLCVHIPTLTRNADRQRKAAWDYAEFHCEKFGSTINSNCATQATIQKLRRLPALALNHPSDGR